MLSFATAHLLYHSFLLLSTTFLFYFFDCDSFPFRNQLDYNIATFIFCQQVFLTFFKNFFASYFCSFKSESSERRRRDLNPRAAVNDLHPFQGCPFGQLGYFSELLTIYACRSDHAYFGAHMSYDNMLCIFLLQKKYDNGLTSVIPLSY